MAAPEVMLAAREADSPEQVITRLERLGYMFELKFDGIRAVITRRGSDVQITNRRGANITHRYPEIITELQAWEPFTAVLDGEIIVKGPDGRPSFPMAHLRDAQSTPSKIRVLAAQKPAEFIPFDLLELDGLDVRGWSYLRRRAALEDLLEGEFRLPMASPHGSAMWEFVREQRLEGLIAKRVDSTYRPGRQRAWVKIKSLQRLTALVTGVVPGKGSRGDVGALELGLWDSQSRTLVEIGSVGSGLSAAEQATVKRRIGMKGPPIVVEVEYLEVSPGGQLRMPVFLGFRNDVDLLSASTSQLDQ